MNVKGEMKRQLQQRQQQQILERLGLASTKDVLIRSAGGCFAVLDQDAVVVSDALLRCISDVVADALKFSQLRQSGDEISFEDVLLAVRKDALTLSRIIAKLSMLDGRDLAVGTNNGNVNKNNNNNKRQQTGNQSSSRLRRAFAILGPLHPEAFAPSASASGLFYGRLLRIDDAHNDGGESSSGSAKYLPHFGNDMKTPAMKMWLSTLTGGLPVSESALELLGFCLYEFSQQISDIATLQATAVQRPELSKSSTLCYTGSHCNILPEATRRFLENRRAIRRT